MMVFRNVLIATEFLTRLPIPAKLQSPWTLQDLRNSVHMFPLVGVLVGLVASLVYAAAVFCNLPPALAALLTVAAQVLITGGLHEDGLADVADGFGGGGTRELKLEIMRDSRLGTYGAIGLILSLALRATAIAHLSHPETVAAGLITAAVLSRTAMPIAMRLLPKARAEGLSAGQPKQDLVLLGLGLGMAVVFLCLPAVTAGVAIVACLIASSLFLSLARRQIGGITGDVLGGLQQILEIVCLMSLMSSMSG